MAGRSRAIFTSAARPAARSPRGRRLPRDHDPAAREGEVAASGQVLDDAAHHLARGADAIGDVLLRQPLADAPLAAFGRIGDVVQTPDDTRVDVLERQALDALGG